MDHSCMKQLVNPYRECRKQAATYNRALSSMEKAAELLGVAVSTMSNYELGITVPPVDIMQNWKLLLMQIRRSRLLI